MVGQLKSIFHKLGHGLTWDNHLASGNPTCGPDIAGYIHVLRKEQSAAHMIPRQAKPLFFDKLEAVCNYLRADLQHHVGWRSEWMAQRYARTAATRELDASRHLQIASDGARPLAASTRRQYRETDYDALPSAFVNTC